MNTLKNIDEIHFDLSQVLLDMQFMPQTKADLKRKYDDEDFKTFWESQQYRPYKKVIIFTTEKYLMPNKCYSFDFNYLF